MTSLRTIDRRLDVLTPDERFRLVALAHARGDRADVRRLVDACPTFTYSMPDLAYQDRVRALHDVLGLMVLVLQNYKARARLDDAIDTGARLYGDIAAKLCALAYQHGWEDARIKGKGAPGVPDPAGYWWEDTAERWAGQTAPALGAWRAECAAWWRAADAWARDTTGAGAGALVAGWFETDYVVEMVTWADDVAAAADPDPADVAEARAALDGLWARLVRDA